MKQSNIYLVEIFNKNFGYIASCQINTLKYEYDYLSLSRNKIEVPLTDINEGYWLRITDMKKNIIGIIENMSESKKGITVSFKDVLSICDVNVFKDVGALLTGKCTIETWIAEAIREIYISSKDIMQTLPIYNISTISNTYVSTALEIEDNVNSLYDLLKTMLIKYGVVVRFDVDMKLRGITCLVGKVQNKERHIEADLPNILSKNIEIDKRTTTATNKITIINEDNLTQQQDFYLLSDGKVTTEYNDSLRITPVVFDYKKIKISEDETFDNKAYAQALEELTPQEYNNLIELQLMTDDSMNDPLDWEIGQRGIIMSGNKTYLSIYTGYEIKDKVITMIFGAIRNELTKKMKRRIAR